MITWRGVVIAVGLIVIVVVAEFMVRWGAVTETGSAPW